MKKQKENSYEGITWSQMGKQNVQAEKVYTTTIPRSWAKYWNYFSSLSSAAIKKLIGSTETIDKAKQIFHKIYSYKN